MLFRHCRMLQVEFFRQLVFLAFVKSDSLIAAALLCIALRLESCTVAKLCAFSA